MRKLGLEEVDCPGHVVIRNYDLDLSSPISCCCSSRSVMSDSLWPQGLQHTRLPCPSPSPGACSNLCLLSRCCCPTVSSCHPLLLPSVFPSISLFWWVDSSKQAAKVLDFSISPSSEYSGLISFRVDWLDLLALQGTLKSLLQHQSSKASIPWCSAFFMVQLSHPYILTSGKTIALTIRTCVTK